MNEIRHNWTLEELKNLYYQPLIELISKAHLVHVSHHDPREIQVNTIISIKTGGCPEDCKYCSQSARYQTATTAKPFMKFDEVLFHAKKAIARGATRVCLSAAWREIKEGKQFDQILEMIQSITNLGVEVCCTLGMLKESQAKQLKEAGLYAYNHNLDTSENFYNTIITSRTYQDRLNTLDIAHQAGISLCCGGIMGLGETEADRLEWLQTLSKRNPHPESVPINRLTPIPGTPLENATPLSIWEMIRIIATARLVLPKSMLRLSAGRREMSNEQQALCFLAGANSIHAGEKLLTLANTSCDQDDTMFQILGLTKRPAFKP